MMESRHNCRAYIVGQIEVMTVAIEHGLLDDAEILLNTVRSLRPGFEEAGAFEAMIYMRRNLWAEAIRTLRGLEASRPNFGMTQALLAFCQRMTGDSQWRQTAAQVLDSGPSPEAAAMARGLLEPGSPAMDGADDAAADVVAGVGLTTMGILDAGLMRA